MTLVSAIARGNRFGRAALIALAAATWTPALTSASLAASDRPASYVRTVTKEIMAAVRSGSPYTMAKVIRRHGDLPDISLYSLGSYRKGLPRNRRTSFYDGVARFMARYFVAQSKLYPVAKIEVVSPSTRADWGHKVDSRFTLRNGDTYTVRWLIVPRGKGYKIRDANLLGFWLTPFQKRLFEDYIDEHGGKVTALLAVLGS